MPRIASKFSALAAVVAAGAVALLLLSLSVSPSPEHIDPDTSRQAHIYDSVAFLRNKGVLQDSEFADQKFAYLLNPSTSKNRKLYEGCQHRAQLLVDAASTSHEARAYVAPVSTHHFSDAEFPGYDALEMVRDNNTLVQRQQLSQHCYSQAGVVLQYYLIWHTLHRRGITVSEHGVLDVTCLVAGFLTAKELEDYVFHDSGMSSVLLLERILEPGSVVIASSLELVEENRMKYGAGLVAGFHVYQDFVNSSVHHHYGLPSGDFLGLHAMVLIGTRMDSGTQIFMLQNW